MTAPPLQAIAASLVLLALAAFTLDSLLNGRARHARFKALTQSADRQAALHRRLLRAVVQFGLFSIVGLAAIGRLGALWSMPPEIGRLRDQLALQALGAQPAETQVLGPILAVGIVAGALLASLAG